MVFQGKILNLTSLSLYLPITSSILKSERTGSGEDGESLFIQEIPYVTLYYTQNVYEQHVVGTPSLVLISVFFFLHDKGWMQKCTLKIQHTEKWEISSICFQ